MTRESGRVGDWRMQSTAVVQREKHGPHLVAFLFPPPGFAGKARLSVISAARREEFTHAWASEDATPLLFSIPVADSTAEALARADLLLEIAAPGRAPVVVTGDVAFRAPRETARIELAPMLLGGEDAAGAWLEVLAQDAELRLGVDAAKLAALPDEAARTKARELIGTGRLEIVDVAGEVPRIPLPFPQRTRVTAVPPQADLAGLPVGVRALLLLGTDVAAWAAALHPVLREFPFRILAPARSALACVVPAPCVLDPHVRADGARAAAALDRMLLALPAATPGAATPITISRGGAPALRPPGFCVLPMENAPELRALAGFVKDWNRRHTTPQLQLATPADYFALLEELEAHGALAVPRIELS